MCSPEQDLNRKDFVQSMAKHIANIVGGNSNDYLDLCDSHVSMIIGEFETLQHDDYDWCIEVAKECAMEEISYF